MARTEDEERFFKQWRDILMAESSIEEGGLNCRVVGARFHNRTQQGGYPIHTVRIPGAANRNVTVARLMYMCCTRSLQLQGDISHKCHNRLCVRMDHLILEPRSVNNSRQICNAQKYCTRKHEPQCIFPEVSQ